MIIISLKHTAVSVSLTHALWSTQVNYPEATCFLLLVTSDPAKSKNAFFFPFRSFWQTPCELENHDHWYSWDIEQKVRKSLCWGSCVWGHLHSNFSSIDRKEMSTHRRRGGTGGGAAQEAGRHSTSPPWPRVISQFSEESNWSKTRQHQEAMAAQISLTRKSMLFSVLKMFHSSICS